MGADKGKAKGGERVAVQKTYKLYVGGAFIRSESGKTLRQEDASGAFLANLCRASRKDLRGAVQAARKAQGSWAKRSAFNRSQILFRIAEVLESRRAPFEAALVQLQPRSEGEARAEVEAAIDRMFWYAGWADKFSQALGCVNPVALPFFNFSVPEPTGVVAIFAPQNSALLGLISAIAPVVLSGNTCVVLVDHEAASIAIDLAEILATSDVPGGVVNLLTCQHEELRAHVSQHMDVNAVACFGGTQALRTAIQEDAAVNLKRVALFDDPPAADWHADACQSPYWIERFVEWKTAWHPIGV